MRVMLEFQDGSKFGVSVDEDIDEDSITDLIRNTIRLKRKEPV